MLAKLRFKLFGPTENQQAIEKAVLKAIAQITEASNVNAVCVPQGERSAFRHIALEIDPEYSTMEVTYESGGTRTFYESSIVPYLESVRFVNKDFYNAWWSLNKKIDGRQSFDRDLDDQLQKLQFPPTPESTFDYEKMSTRLAYLDYIRSYIETSRNKLKEIQNKLLVNQQLGISFAVESIIGKIVLINTYTPMLIVRVNTAASAHYEEKGKIGDLNSLHKEKECFLAIRPGEHPKFVSLNGAVEYCTDLDWCLPEWALKDISFLHQASEMYLDTLGD